MFTVELCSDFGDIHRHLNAIRQLYAGSKRKLIEFGCVTDTRRRHALFIVLNEEKELVGLATLSTIYKLTGKEGRVEEFLLHPSVSSKGLKKMLTDAIQAEAARLALKTVHGIGPP